jgi:hypothetical protein
MIPSPYRFERNISDQELAKLGILTLRWSHTEHILANCLRVMLRLSEKEGRVMVFPLHLEQRINRITEIAEITPLPPHASAAFEELKPIMKGIQYVRNNVIHSIVLESESDGHLFHLRSKNKSLTKAEVFSVEEITNYATHLVRAFRFALGEKDGPDPVLYPWPKRPEIPEFLRSVIQFPKTKETAKRKPQPQS